MQKWTDCQKRLVTVGKHGLFRRVREFDFTGLNAEQASQAHNLIGRCLRKEVAFVSTGAEVFYCWVSKEKIYLEVPRRAVNVFRWRITGETFWLKSSSSVLSELAVFVRGVTKQHDVFFHAMLT